MKSHLCNHTAAAFLLMPVVAILMVLPLTAQAQPTSLDVESLKVTVDLDLSPGSRLKFRTDVAAASSPAAPAAVSLQVTSHANNAQVGSGATLVQGRTAPGAFVDVKVSANANEQVSTQRVQADANGNFSFSFTPQMPLPGTRYEVNIVATRGNVRAEATLVLFQR
jgi:hypothetical protein